MRTNFQMIVDFKDYAPQERGITSLAEIRRIQEHFCLSEMDVIALQNLRDMVVLIYSNWRTDARNNADWDELDRLGDAMYSIASVIDIVKVNVGVNVEDL